MFGKKHKQAKRYAKILEREKRNTKLVNKFFNKERIKLILGEQASEMEVYHFVDWLKPKAWVYQPTDELTFFNKVWLAYQEYTTLNQSQISLDSINQLEFVD